MQGGDFIHADGTGCRSSNIFCFLVLVYGDKFNDENFTLKHSSPGLLSMANSGPNTNGCQFFITCANAEFLDGKHVVFGRVLDGLFTLRKMESVPVGVNNRPKLPIIIAECGEM